MDANFYQRTSHATQQKLTAVWEKLLERMLNIRLNFDIVLALVRYAMEFSKRDNGKLLQTAQTTRSVIFQDLSLIVAIKPPPPAAAQAAQQVQEEPQTPPAPEGSQKQEEPVPAPNNSSSPQAEQAEVPQGQTATPIPPHQEAQPSVSKSNNAEQTTSNSGSAKLIQSSKTPSALNFLTTIISIIVWVISLKLAEATAQTGRPSNSTTSTPPAPPAGPA